MDKVLLKMTGKDKPCIAEFIMCMSVYYLLTQSGLEN